MYIYISIIQYHILHIAYYVLYVTHDIRGTLASNLGNIERIVWAEYVS